MGPTPLEGVRSPGPETHRCRPEGHLAPLLYMLHHEKSTEGRKNLRKTQHYFLFATKPMNTEKWIRPLDFYLWHGHLRHKT